MNKKEIRFLLPLDIILDTKLAVLNSIDPDATYKILTDKSYFNRMNNDWETLTEGKITNSEFNEKWALRNKDTLKASILTGISPYLKSLIMECETMDLTDPGYGLPVILLNTWPYTDLDEVDLESLRKAVNISCGGAISDTRLTYSSTTSLSPSYLKEHIDYVFMDNFEEWSVMHTDDLVQNKMTNVCVTVPKLFLKEPPTSEELKLDGEHEMSPWKMTELLFLEFVKLNMIDVKFFSIIFS